MWIDAHQHFWKYNSEQYGWITDEMQVIKRDCLPADLLPELHKRNLGMHSVRHFSRKTRLGFCLNWPINATK